MATKSAFAIIALITAALTSRATAEPGQPVLGVWQMADRQSAAEFYDCADKVCARLVWFKSAVGPDGHPPLDRHNPDPALRNRPLCGLTIITQLSPRSAARFDGGKVYSAGDGKTYDLTVSLESPTRLRLRGYLGTPVLGQTLFMNRNNDLPHC